MTELTIGLWCLFCMSNFELFSRCTSYLPSQFEYAVMYVCMQLIRLRKCICEGIFEKNDRATFTCCGLTSECRAAGSIFGLHLATRNVELDHDVTIYWTKLSYMFHCYCLATTSKCSRWNEYWCISINMLCVAIVIVRTYDRPLDECIHRGVFVRSYNDRSFSPVLCVSSVSLLAIHKMFKHNTLEMCAIYSAIWCAIDDDGHSPVMCVLCVP